MQFKLHSPVKTHNAPPSTHTLPNTHTHERDNHNAPPQRKRERGADVCAHIMLPAERRHRLALIGGHAPARARDTDPQDAGDTRQLYRPAILESCSPAILPSRLATTTAGVFVRGRRLYCFKCHAFIVCPLSLRADSIQKH